MLISRYSKPEFDPYGDNSPTEEDVWWPAPTTDVPLQAVLALPGSKSLTNRELVASALASEPSLLRAPLHSRDSDLMVDALRQLGATIEAVAGAGAFGTDLRVTPPVELLGSTTIDCGLAGTVMRFLPALAALALGPTTFDGDAGARRRPMGPIIGALRDLGGDINDDGKRALPFTVHGRGAVAGGAVTIDAGTSSQFVSGLLRAGARFEQGLHLTHSGERLPSLPHIEMTIEVLRSRGVVVATPKVGEWIVEPGEIAGRTVDIEPDLSNAAPFLCAALVSGGSVTIIGWPETTTQVGADLEQLLPLFGATVTRAGDRLTVTGGEHILGVDLDLSTGGELACTLVALAALAETPSMITGIGHIRNHETDRLAALATEINRLGGQVTELPDGLHVEPAPLHGGQWLSYADHRMATAGALIGLRVAGVEVENIGTTAKTLPQFPELWHTLITGTAL